MMYGVFSVRDVKTGFMTPTIDQNDDSAARNFYHAVVSTDGILQTYASDFSLYRIADFDSDTGRMIPFDIPEMIAEGAHALRVLGKESKDVSSVSR
ncbi:nonstructural protein [Sigmofec virus UA08Rod_5899]|uniref:Nonstructural protein n=1 Tax=Sigmofec virus UA08Rod_5899 TaxID=2929445 RepID=A0A976N121_9VIRU|nr:nonstructural protein [Sigmofec virus UA08Rod_5899]